MIHPLHPYVVHFSVALIVMSVVLIVVGTAFRNRAWSAGVLAAARWNLWIGAGCALASIGTGFTDYIAAHCDGDAIAATILHRRTGAVTWWSSLIAAIAVYRTRQRAPGPVLIGWLVLVAVAALAAARLGTNLTYAHAVGVESAVPAGGQACFEMERGSSQNSGNS